MTQQSTGTKALRMRQDQTADDHDWSELEAADLQTLLAELRVRVSLEEAECLRQLLCAVDDPETALELLAQISKAA